MSSEQIGGWESRKVDYRVIHGDESDAFEKLLDEMHFLEGMRLGDFMCGYGYVSKYILERRRQKEIGINLVMVDAYPQQLDRSRDFLGEYPDSTITRFVE